LNNSKNYIVNRSSMQLLLLQDLITVCKVTVKSFETPEAMYPQNVAV